MSLFEDASLIITPNGRKSGKIFALKPFNGSGDLTVVRATTATEVNASGVIVNVASNVARFDYTNGSCPSILVEPQRTNLLLRSEEFDNAIWTKTSGVVVTSNSEISPNGTLTADTINFGASNRFVSQATTLATGVVATGSIYVKGISGQTIQLAVGGVDVLFTLNGNWQKLEATRTSITSIFNLNTFGGATARIISIWGAQLEAGANATSYIPTVASTVTRNADVISKTGISDLIGQTEGTIFCDVNLNNLPIGNQTPLILGFNNTVDSVRIRFRVSIVEGLIFYNSSIVAQITHNISQTGRYKTALSYNNNYAALFVNGVKVGQDLTVSTQNLSSIGLGAFSSGFEHLNNNINSALVFKTQLTDQQCISMTQL